MAASTEKTIELQVERFAAKPTSDPSKSAKGGVKLIVSENEVSGSTPPKLSQQNGKGPSPNIRFKPGPAPTAKYLQVNWRIDIEWRVPN
jgi:hypothetical protein